MSALLWYGVPRRLTRRLLGATVGCQGVAVFLWAITAFQLARAAGHGASALFLWSGVGVAVLALVASGTLRRPVGVTLGWVVQAACLLMCLVVPLMAVVALLFGGLWIVAMVQGRVIDDLREDAEQRYAEYEAQHGHRPGEDPGDEAGRPGGDAAASEGHPTTAAD